MTSEYQRIRERYAQLIECELIARRIGHGPDAVQPDHCELCHSLRALRRQVDPNDRIALAVVIERRANSEPTLPS